MNLFSMCAYVQACMCHDQLVEVMGQLSAVSFLLLPCDSWGSTPQTWQQVSTHQTVAAALHILCVNMFTASFSITLHHIPLSHDLSRNLELSWQFINTFPSPQRWGYRSSCSHAQLSVQVLGMNSCPYARTATAVTDLSLLPSPVLHLAVHFITYPQVLNQHGLKTLDSNLDLYCAPTLLLLLFPK